MVTYFKIFYLYLCNLLVGLDEGGYQYKKAVYLTELGFYFAAIKALKRAEKELKTSYVWGLLGWCYANVEAFEESLHFYRLASKTDSSEPVLLGLAVAESHAGSIENAKNYIEQLKPFREDPVLNKYVVQVEQVLKSREGS